MSFAAEEFYDLATWLCGGATPSAQNHPGARTDEVAIRTAISRTYYAAHLLAREALFKKGWSPPYGEVHGAVLAELRKRNKTRLAGDLATLQRLRNHADYHIECNSGHSSNVCRLCEQVAKMASSPVVVNADHWRETTKVAPGLIDLLKKF